MTLKEKTLMVFDTETIGVTRKFIYDIAWIITNKKGKILKATHHLVNEIITNPRMMMDAYYAQKIFSHYIPALNEQQCILTPWKMIRDLFLDDIKTFDVRVLSAYNLLFDKGAMTATHQLLSPVSGKFLTQRVDMLDIWLFACSCAFNRSSYHELAKRYNWISDAGNVRTTAQHAYRYLCGDRHFEEQHIAIHDAQIETEILARLFAQKKTVPYNVLNAMPWRIAQKIKK